MLLIVAVYLLVLLLFCAGFYFMHPVKTLQQAGQAARTAYSTMTDASLDDYIKEQTVQRCAIELAKQAVSLTVKLAVVLFISAVPVLLASVAGLMEADAFGRFALRLDVLLITTLVLLALVFAHRRLQKN